MMALLAASTVWAESYITDVMVIGGSKNEVNALKASYAEQGWTLIDQDLNGGASGDYIYLLYKAASEATEGASFITDFVISTERGTLPDTLVCDGRDFFLVPCDGSSYFINNQGDLNSHCSGSAYIHLYYTKEYLASGKDYGTLKSITFNNTQAGAVCENGGTTGYDLNTGAGGNYIYMHLGKSQGWTVIYSSAENRCLISGFDGPKQAFKSLTIPLSIGGNLVAGFLDFSFLQFPNLETMNFIDGTIIEEMPILDGATKFSHVNVLNDSTFDMRSPNELPYNMTKLPGRAFAGTNIESIVLANVSEFGPCLFAGCKALRRVGVSRADINVQDYAFSYIESDCDVYSPHFSTVWLPRVYMYSPHTLIRIPSARWAAGWCGGTSAEDYNNLYWMLNTDCQLRIQNYNLMGGDSHPENKTITSRTWYEHKYDVPGVMTIILEDVYTIPTQTFKDDSYDLLRDIYMNTSVHYIKSGAITCSSKVNLWFDGGQPEWDAVVKEQKWATNMIKTHWHCRVTFDANGHGTAPDSEFILWSNYSMAHNPGAPTDVEAGYNFLGWYTEPECTTKWFFGDAVPGDMTLYAGWESLYTTGDVDGSGVVDGSDLNILINILLGKDTNDYDGRENIDGEGGVDGTDLNMLINILLGKQ